MTDHSSPDGPLSDPTQAMRPARHAPPDPDPSAHPDDEPKTGLIRRAPTGAIPVATPTGHDAPATTYIEPATGLIATEHAPATTFISPAKDAVPPAPKPPPGPAAACATATACILSGWATAVIATSLVAGWWRTDPLFCVAVGFLTAVSAGGIIGGQIAVLLRRRTGRVLVVVGSLVALMIFGSLFVAGAKLPPIVYGIPILPLASIVLVMLPVTGRWCTKT